MKKLLIKTAVCAASTLLICSAFGQTKSTIKMNVTPKAQTLEVHKPISAEDAKAIQSILNQMESGTVSLVGKSANGKTIVYNKPKSDVTAGVKVSDIKRFNNTAVVHSTIKDFFWKTARPSDVRRLEQLKGILQKYQ